MSTLPKAYDPKLVEEKWRAAWEESGLFRANAQSGKRPYCIVMPPPNVTGVLHMGHALVSTQADSLIRTKRMQGFEALWVPGTDHAGIATQTVVERNLLAKTGKRRVDFARAEFLEHVWAWKEESEQHILQQLRKVGCSCDWSRLRFTMDDGANRAVRTMFCKMFNEGLIYRGDYLVNWDPVTETALSDDEVEHEERSSFLWTVRYGPLTVATTRPETILGDTAIAVHPSDERYQALVGKMVRVPLTDRFIPIVADPFVDREFGTGAVKITPAHDFNDYEMAQRHHLPMINLLTPDGRINAAGGAFEGLSVEEARERVVQALTQQGLLVKVEPHTLRVGVSYRSKAVIQPYLSKQWFLRMSQFKEGLLATVRSERTRLVPAYWQETYEHWINHLRDWCISRQLWWGHQIPIWYDREDRNRLICFEGEGVPPEVAQEPDRWEQDPDVLDTWFSSALWPLTVLGWPEKTPDLKTFYPTSTLVTGHDILFFWVARMILMGEYAMKTPPFHDVFLHGLIYGKSYWRKRADGGITYAKSDEKRRYDLGEVPPADVESKWEKMSKSKGNVIDPIEILEEYGTDAMRMALCSSVTHARQIDLDRRRFEEFKNFANKVWNGARFVLLHLESLTGDALLTGLDMSILALDDRWILSVLNRTIADLTEALSQYAFDRLATRTYEFYWNEFCALYVELAKPLLFGKQGTVAEREQKQKLLLIVLLAAIRLLHPIAPFITEEIFSLLRAQFPDLEPISKGDPYTQDLIRALSSPMCAVAPYPTVFDPAHISLEIEAVFESVFQLVYAVRNIRAEMQLPPSEKTELFLVGQLPPEHESILLALTPTSFIHRVSELPSFGASTQVGAFSLLIPIPESFRAKERARLEKERDKLEKLRSSTALKLANREFCEKAPRPVVDALEQQLAQTEQQLSAIAHKLQV